MRSNTDAVLTYVQLLARHFRKDDINAAIVIILFDLGLPSDMEGFLYLRAAIALYHAKTATSMVKGIYPIIAQDHYDNHSWQYIDQAIRRVIQSAWDAREEDTWELFFPSSTRRKTKCPPNKVFIARISCIIELWQSCKEVDYERLIH